MTGRYTSSFCAIAVMLPCMFNAPDAHADQAAPAHVQKKTRKAPAHPPKPKTATVTPASKDKETGKPSGSETMVAPASRSATAGAAPPSGRHDVAEHESRIEFDERMVQGQSATGAVFLFQRTPTEFKSIVEVPASFRAKTVELVKPR